MAKNIDNLMKQYEDLLGEEIGDLDGQMDVELDPETLALQKQLEKMQKQQELQLNQVQQKPQAKPKDDDDLDQILNQYSNPGQKQQQQQIQYEQIQQPKPKPAQPQIDMGAMEAIVMDLSKLNSLNALQAEIKYIQSLITQARGNKSIIDVLNNSIKQCQQHLDKLKQKIKEGAIQAQQYQQQITQSMKDQQQLYVQNQNNQLLKLRLATRVQTLQEEYKTLNQSLKNFDKIAQQFGCGEDPAFKMMVEEIDGKPYKLKIKELLRRHKQYFNFASYLSQYMKQEKEDLLNRVIQSLEKSKQLQIELKNGNNIPIAKFCLSEFPELNEDQFKGCNKIEYQQTITQMIEATQNAIKEEQAYLKIASKAKPVLQKVQGQKNLVTINPADACKQNLQRYELILKYFDDILKQPWFPIPIFQSVNEQRTLSMENRDVPNNTLRVQFKKLSKGGKYYINYSIDLNGFIVGKTEQTNQDGILNYSRDIPLDKSIKSLIGKSFELKLYEKGIFSDSQRGAVVIKLDDLMEFSIIEGDAQFNGYSLNYAILLRESFSKKKTVLTVNVTKMYPQFKVNEGLEEYIESKLIEYPNEGKTVVVQEEKPIIPQQIEQQEEEEESLVDKKELVCLIHQETDPEFLKVQDYAMQNKNIDVLNPEDPKQNPVFYFIKPYEGFLKDKKAEFKTQPSMRIQYKFIDQLWQDYYRQSLLLNKQIEDGDYEKYGKNLENSILRDQQLIKIYEQLNVQTWLKFVKLRLDVALKEQEALKEQS